MFTTNQKQMLKTEMTDYEIDQMAKALECISDEQSSQEKMRLWDELKYAKRLSQLRNLLQNGDFEDIFKGWTTSNHNTICENNPIFTGHYLNMPGANVINGSVFPTYIYQKIDESNLKPYTRYQIRGFVGSSKELRLMIVRYGKEINMIMNVPDDMTYTSSSYDTSYDCEQKLQQSINMEYDHLVSAASCTSIDSKSIVNTKRVECRNLHQFKFHIDTGELNIKQNLGIWVLFQISSSDGYATLDNLEVIEERPLIGEELEHVKQKEKKWHQQMKKRQMETKQTYDQAKQAVNLLFTNTQQLKYTTTLLHIKQAEQLVQSIPYVHNEWLSDVPGTNYDLYTDLNTRIAQARYLYDVRNVITNGNFTQGLQGWHSEGKVDVQQIDKTSVLVLSNWSTGVSQNLHVQLHQGYMLRVTARKEGFGKGYVAIMDCKNNQETLTFTYCDEGYITKTVEVFPESNHVRIEVGETEGSFYIESIELLCLAE
ncbi:pesticidial crystal protein [Bacillus cereus]|uniref:pesticidial crystal protein n=1 Tax=Bacillus cereus TaxID=1396 RepID=UPI003D183B73